MSKRRTSRTFALQMLYAADVGRQRFEQIRQWFWQAEDRSSAPSIRLYAEQLAQGVLTNLGRIDALIESHATHWKIKRMSVIDRNILRLASFELISGDVPAPAVINEAIELAKHFGDNESPNFINGVLDAIHHALPQDTAHFFPHE